MLRRTSIATALVAVAVPATANAATATIQNHTSHAWVTPG